METGTETPNVVAEDTISMLTERVRKLEITIMYHTARINYLNEKLNTKMVEETNEPIIGTLKVLYRLDEYNAGGKTIHVHCVELEEYSNKLFWHMQKKTMEQISIGTKILFKLDGDRIKDAKIIHEQIK